MTYSKRLFILEKAIELFSKHGFEAVSIQDITDHCGISKGAFYLSFKSKDDLMIALIEHLLASASLIFDQAVKNELEPQLKLHKFFEDVLILMRMNRGIVTFFIHEHVHFQSKNAYVLHILAKYEEETRDTFGRLLDSVYGAKISSIRQDLIVSLSSLFKTYFEYVCIRGLEYDVSSLAQSFVEKMNILANAKYEYALPNEVLLKLSEKTELTSDELLIFKERLLDELTLRMEEEAHPLKFDALNEIKRQLHFEQPSSSILYAFSSLLKEYNEYKDFALRLRSYLTIVYPQ